MSAVSGRLASPVQEYPGALKRRRSGDAEFNHFSRPAKRSLLTQSPPQDFTTSSGSMTRLLHSRHMSWDDRHSSKPGPLPGGDDFDSRICLPPIREQPAPTWYGAGHETGRPGRHSQAALHGQPPNPVGSNRTGLVPGCNNVRLPPISSIGIARSESSSTTTASQMSPQTSAPHMSRSLSHTPLEALRTFEGAALPATLGYHANSRSRSDEAHGYGPANFNEQVRPAMDGPRASDMAPGYPLPPPPLTPPYSSSNAGRYPPAIHTTMQRSPSHQGSSVEKASPSSAVPVASYSPRNNSFRHLWSDLPPAAIEEQTNRRRRGNLPKESTALLNDWFGRHLSRPYPTEEDKQEFQDKTGLSMSQVCFRARSVTELVLSRLSCKG